MAASNFGLWLVFVFSLYSDATFVQVNETCIDLSDIGLDPLCVTLRLDTCDTAFDILVTYDSDPIIDFSGDASDSQVCNDAGSECTTCIKFDDDAAHNRAFILEPTYAQLCPVVSTVCQAPFGTWTDEEPLDCVILGIDCSSLKNCGECIATSGCGWCDNSTTCMAQSLTSTEPYCETCSEDLSDTCQSDPTSLSVAQSFFEENRVAIIAGGLASAIFLVVGLIGIRWLKKKSGNHNYTQQRDDVELEQETSSMDLSAVQSINGSPASPQPVTSSGYVPPPVQ